MVPDVQNPRFQLFTALHVSYNFTLQASLKASKSKKKSSFKALLCFPLNMSLVVRKPSFSASGLEVIKLEFILRLKIKRNDWLFADTCPQAANRCALF